MEYIYAAMLLHSAKKDITEEHISAIIKAAGLTVDNAKAKSLVEALKDVSIETVIKEAASAQVVSAPVASAAPSHTEEKPKKDEKKAEEEAAAGLGALFG